MNGSRIWNWRPKRGFLVIALLFLLLFSARTGQGKNVIVLVSDGMGSAHTTITRWYKGAPLALDQMDLGAVRTYSADSLVTDSAPAATAFATGHKSSGKLLGVLPNEVTIPGVLAPPEDLKYKPVATILDAAKLYGKSVGLVATSNVQHATPAAYSSHWHDRWDYQEIAKQQVYLGMDVVLGGGKRYLIPRELGGARSDQTNLIDTLRSRGYAFVETRDELMKSRAKKVWGLFADDAMAYEFDRKYFFPKKEPSLAEMTRKAIEILSTNPRGFFLFVEASKVDWASHANDPIGVISDVLAFDDAVRVAIDFARRDGKTLVLAFADHGTGGMTLGRRGSERDPSRVSLDALLAPLKKARLTGEGVEQRLRDDLSEANIRKVMAQVYGIDDLRSEEVAQIQTHKRGRLNAVIGPMMSKRSVIGWATTGHTGEDLFLYSFGTGRSIGLIENTEIARLCANYLGVDLEAADKRLYREAQTVFKTLGASVRIDRTVKENPVLRVEKGSVTALLPLSKNLMKVRAVVSNSNVLEAEYELEGIVVMAAPTGKVYVPEHALIVFQSMLHHAEERGGAPAPLDK
jgi:alkaline phosphatase